MKKIGMILCLSGLLVLSACMSEDVVEEAIEDPAFDQVEEQVEEETNPEPEDKETDEQVEETVEEVVEEATVLSEEEAVQFIMDVEQKAVDVLSSSFEMGEEELSFSNSFEEIASQLTDVYALSMIEGKFKGIYEKPGRFYEPRHEFPLARQDLPPNQVLIHSEEEMTVFAQPEINEEKNDLYQYSLAVEENKWKIIDIEKYLSPSGAETAVRHVTKLHDPEINVVFDGSNQLEDHVTMLEKEESFIVQVYVFNEHATVTLGWYSVDPATGTVYELDLLENEYTEIGTY
ncbi:hypothetical protein [Halalkalibacter alkalisediminis]|uniref:Lipoprotein n=1 Tax=Halalkalibacter alkalisediminis TaxID=935616 RepID=A0ABV6NL64_9BACI|nr:hypothetical protein [Halalkalibacter alkalisediminis]